MLEIKAAVLMRGKTICFGRELYSLPCKIILLFHSKAAFQQCCSSKRLHALVQRYVNAIFRCGVSWLLSWLHASGSVWLKVLDSKGKKRHGNQRHIWGKLFPNKFWKRFRLLFSECNLVTKLIIHVSPENSVSRCSWTCSAILILN